MRGDQLERAARLLFGGDDWRKPFEAAYGVNQVTIRRMVRGDKPVPPGLSLEVEQDLRERGNRIDAFMLELCEA